MSTAATEAEILAVLERWARVRGFVMHSRTGYNAYDSKGWGLHINPLPPHGSLLVVPPGQTELMGIEVSPALALAWAITVETDPEPVDVGRCPACVERGGTHEWRKVPPGESLSGWTTMGGWQRGAEDYLYSAASRPCPACSGTGRETVPLARLLLDAAADAAARERAIVHADHLQAKGHPLGEVVGLALGPWAGEPTETIQRVVSGPTTSDGVRAEIAAKCGGHLQGWRLQVHSPGYQGYIVAAPEWTAIATYERLGHPGTTEALSWLADLTASRPRRDWERKHPGLHTLQFDVAWSMLEQLQGSEDAPHWLVTRCDMKASSEGPGVEIRATYTTALGERLDVSAVVYIEAERLVGFQIEWVDRPGSTTRCRRCDGTGHVDEGTPMHPQRFTGRCPACDGSGRRRVAFPRSGEPRSG